MAFDQEWRQKQDALYWQEGGAKVEKSCLLNEAVY